MKKGCVRTTVHIPNEMHKEAKKRNLNLSNFLTKMLEREFAGEFHQLKINEKEKELVSLKSQNTKIQSFQQEQKERAEESYKKAEEEVLERRRQNMLRRKDGV